MSDKLSSILNDRESGSVALLNRLMYTLEEELRTPDLELETFYKLALNVRENLKHFAAIDNFLDSLIRHLGQTATFPGDALGFMAEYSLYWQDGGEKIAENFLKYCQPEGKTILTHSHSQTIISLLEQLHLKQISFRILQTLSIPGEEGRKSHESMRRLGLQADLIHDADLKEAVDQSDLILIGCDALLATEFLNKTGTGFILEQARQIKRLSVLVTESRKKVSHPGWKRKLNNQALFEWVPLNLVDRVVMER